MIVGKVGHNIEIEEAVAAARACGLAIIAQLNDATNSDLDKISRIVKLGGFVNCVDTFTQQPEIINGASNLMVEVFGEAGKHSRFAVGTNSLPRGVVVEVEAIAEIK
jgi:enamine deaminase RidA (YjgF/YER057c/UK114 family)